MNLHTNGWAPGAGYYDLSFKIGNDGNTATAGLTLIVDCVKRDVAEQEPFDLLIRAESNVFRDVIPPKGETEVFPKLRTRCRVLQGDLEKVAFGTQHIYLLGEAKYRDTVGSEKLHITQFAKELTVDIATYGVQRPIASAFTRGQHNCADDDCPK